MQNSTTLEFDEWIKLAEAKNLLLRPEDYYNLTINTEYTLVEADYMKFLFLEYADQYNILANTTYSPEYVYGQISRKMIPNGIITSHNSFVHENGSVIEKPVNYYGFNTMSLYCVGEWLASGSGDGYSRWILWENLKEMPNIYFKE